MAPLSRVYSVSRNILFILVLAAIVIVILFVLAAIVIVILSRLLYLPLPPPITFHLGDTSKEEAIK